MHVAKCLAAASLLAAMMLAGCSREPESKPAASTAPVEKTVAGWPGFVDSFIEARFKADPYFAVQAGRHDFDGKMPDWSRAAIDSDVAELRRFQGDLAKYDPATLTPDQRFEREYLEWVVDTQLFWLVSAEAPYRNPAWYLDKLDPSMYLTREYAPLPKTARGVSRLRARRAGSHRQHSRQSAHAVAQGLHRPWGGRFRRLRHILPQRNARHLRAACRREAEARSQRGDRGRGRPRWMN